MTINTLKASLATLAVVVMGATLASMMTPARASASGSWNEVCCGSLCSTGKDYCIGTGDKTCCKEIQD